MDDAQYIDAIRRAGAAFRADVVTAGMEAGVAACPGWKVADLVWHLAEVHYFWGSIIAQRAGDWNEVVRIDRVPDAQLLDAFDTWLVRLLDQLTITDPTTEVWTWAEDHSVGFVLRRMAHETAMRAWDASAAAGTPVPIDAELASDGIDEYLEHFLPDVVDGVEPVGGSVHIHCGDVAGEWTIRPAADSAGFDVTREHAKGDCALRGGASDLFLALWRRVGQDAIDVVGDADVARRFLATANLD